MEALLLYLDDLDDIWHARGLIVERLRGVLIALVTMLPLLAVALLLIR